jgi:MFS family permease
LSAGFLAFVANAGIFAIWLLASFYLVGARSLSTSASGAVFMLTPLGMTVVAPLVGRVVDRVGPQAPLVLGLALEAAGLAVFGVADERTSIVLVALALYVTGTVEIWQIVVIEALVGAAAFGYLIAGPLGEALGSRQVMVGGAAVSIVVLTAGLLVRETWTLRRLERAPA